MSLYQFGIFLSGGVMAANVFISFFFARYWKKTGERFFLYFSMAFALMSLERVLLFTTFRTEPQSWVFLIRLLAFVLVIIGIVGKNRRERKPKALSNS